MTLSYFGYCLRIASGAAPASWLSLSAIECAVLPLLSILTVIGFATVITGILSWVALLVAFVYLHSASNGPAAISAGLSPVSYTHLTLPTTPYV